MNSDKSKVLDIASLSDSLVEVSPGYWSTQVGTNDISYPESHHQELLEEQTNSFWYRHRARCIKALLGRFQCSNLLDVGGSNGLLSSYLSDITDVILLEPHISGIENARNLGIKNVIQAGFMEAKFKPASIEAIGLFDVLEHIKDDVSFLHEIHRSLKKEGRLFLTVPAYQTLLSSFDQRVGHFRRYNQKSLSKKLEKAGFEIEYFSYMFYLLPVPVWIIRKLLGKDSPTKVNASHASINKNRGAILYALLKPEHGVIKKGKSVPFGTSCICVVKKTLS